MAEAQLLVPDMDEPISPRQPAPSIERPVQPVGPTNTRLTHLDLRADPDAQATVSDFLDFTEYLPADIARSLTLIGNLDAAYVDASENINTRTALWGQLPSLPPDQKTDAVKLRGQTSADLHHALNSRIFSVAEAQRMAENVYRHYARAGTILGKLKTMLENYPAADEQKSPVTAKSPQMSRAPKMNMRADGKKVRRPRVPRITVPGEVLAPYELTYDAYTTGTDSSSDDDDDDDDGLSSRVTPAPHARIKVVKVLPKAPKPGRPPRPRTSVPPPAFGGTLSTSAVMAQLAPPPENAVIGSADAPWGQLTQYELARLRKRMKKNAAWTPSDTMVARELKALGRGVDAFKAAKQKAEDEGQVFEGEMPVPSVDPDTGEKRMPLGALTMEALASDEKNLSNRGMKLNEAKKLKREMLAKMAAEEAEESARRFDAIARTLMSDSNQANNVQDQSKAAGKAKAPRKRKRDSAPEAETERPDMMADGQPPQRPQIKRTKTETPVPPPVLTPGGSQLALETPTQPLPQRTAAAGMIHSTTPIPLPIHGQEQSITAKSVTSAASATSPTNSYTGPIGVSALPPVKIPPTETPILPPVISPKKSMTPILPPTRETRKVQAVRAPDQQQLEPPPATFPAASSSLSRSVSPSFIPKPDPDATPSSTATITRRPTSRGKAASQEPQQQQQQQQPSLAADRPRRASTARNTPAPEQQQQQQQQQQQASSSATAAGAAAALAAAGARPTGKRAKRPAPGIISRTNSGGNSAVGKRKAAPRKKSASARGGKATAAVAARDASKTTAADGGEMLLHEVEVDDEGNPIDPLEERYCLCNRVSFGTMIQCDNVDQCKQEWFHLECVGLADIPARTTKWYCPDCRKLLNIGEKGEVSARGVRA